MIGKDGLEGLPMAFARELRSHAQMETGAEHEQVMPSQRGIVWGSAWVTGHHEGPLGVHLVWGKVLAYGEVMTGRLLAGDSVEELAKHKQDLLRRYDRGWRLSVVDCECRWGSGAELLSLHRSNMWPIRMEEYLAATDKCFCRRRYYNQKWFLSMRDRIAQEQEEER